MAAFTDPFSKCEARPKRKWELIQLRAISVPRCIGRGSRTSPGWWCSWRSDLRPRSSGGRAKSSSKSWRRNDTWRASCGRLEVGKTLVEVVYAAFRHLWARKIYPKFSPSLVTKVIPLLNIPCRRTSRETLTMAWIIVGSGKWRSRRWQSGKIIWRQICGA